MSEIIWYLSFSDWLISLVVVTGDREEVEEGIRVINYNGKIQ